jgi:hypothetical protein
MGGGCGKGGRMEEAAAGGPEQQFSTYKLCALIQLKKKIFSFEAELNHPPLITTAGRYIPGAGIPLPCCS